MKDTLDVSIVVSNFNSSRLLNGALESVVATVGDISFEVFVIDDASTDGGLSLVDERYAQDGRFIFFQNEKNVGISALNVVREQARGTYFLTLDADARLHPGSLRALVDFMNTHPDAGGATGNLLNTDGSPQRYYRRLITPVLLFYTTLIGRFFDKYFFNLRYFKHYRYYDIDVSVTQEIEQPPIACLIFRREVAGGEIMDPQMYLLSIDVDFCKRIYEKGFKIYLVAEAPVTHIKSVSFAKRESSWRRREYYGGLYLYFKKHYPQWLIVLLPMLWLDRVLRALLTPLFGREILR